MKRLLKIIGLVLGIAVLLLMLGLAYINYSPLPSFENKAPLIKVEGDSAMIAEGARMASMMCANCHRSNDGKLGGNIMPDAKAFGEIYAPNITQHPEFGILDYSDGELIYLLRTGIKKNGQYSPPYMPKYPNLSDSDLHAIIAFLRSDHALVQPSDKNPPDSKPSFLAKFLSRVAFGPLPFPEKEIIAPPSTDQVAFGKYVSTAKFDCYACHSASFEKMDVLQPENSEGYFGGGNELFDLDGNLILSPNLTSDKETGLGNWSQEDFVRLVKTGVKPDKTSIAYPMAPYPAMTDEEISAVWTYLQTIPRIHNKKLMNAK